MSCPVDPEVCPNPSDSVIDLRDGLQKRKLIWYSDEMKKSTICKYRLIPDGFDRTKQVNIETHSFNTNVFLLVVKEKGKFETAVYQTFRNGKDMIKLQKNE